MAIWDWFLGLFNRDGYLNLSDKAIEELKAELVIKEMAIGAAIGLISNSIAKCEFQTFVDGKQKKGENYYRLNVEPNQNESAQYFWGKVIWKMVNQRKCLVIQIDKKYYVADSFDEKTYALYENEYKNVKIGDFTFGNKTFKESEVFVFRMTDEHSKRLIDAIYSSYGKLITAGQLRYKRKGAFRGKLKVPTSYPSTEKATKELTELLEKRFKTFFEAEGGSVMPMTNGLDYEELNQEYGKNSSTDGRDIRAFIDDIFDFTAISMQIPPQLLKGSVANTDQVVNNFLTFCLTFYTEILANEINRKLYGQAAYTKRTFLKIDTSRVKVVEIKDIANSLDVLFRIGAHSINDNLRILGLEELDETWANERFVTKNYQRLMDLKGGGDSGKG